MPSAMTALLKGDPQLRSPEGNPRYKAFPHTRLAALGKIETATSMSTPGRLPPDGADASFSERLEAEGQLDCD